MEKVTVEDFKYCYASLDGMKEALKRGFISSDSGKEYRVIPVREDHERGLLILSWTERDIRGEVYQKGSEYVVFCYRDYWGDREYLVGMGWNEV